MDWDLLNYDYAKLPDEVWLKILVYLDARSILAMEQSSPRFESIVYDHVVTNDVRCSPNVSPETLHAFFTAKRAPLIKRLHLNNCIMVGSEDVLNAARLCINLTSLSCVSCQVNPAGLFALLSSAHSLVELEWSLYQETRYADRLWAVRELLSVNPDIRACLLSYMYVEVVGDANTSLLTSMLSHCSVLRRLHVHSVQSDHYVSIERWSNIWRDNLTQLHSFTYSLEEPPSRQLRGPYSRFARKNVVFRVAASLLGNAVVNTQPVDTVNCVFLSDVVGQPTTIAGFQQLVIAIKEPNSRSVKELDAAAQLDCWAQVRSLSITLVPADRVCQLPQVGSTFTGPLRSLFAAWGAITELNLTSFHVSADVNCAGIVGATLPMLRALAVAPCGLIYEDSVDHLAAGCARLEELDVRVSRDDASAFCKACERPLRIRQSSMEVLQSRSQLKRLSLCDIQKVASLNFLLVCQLEELRIFTLTWGEDWSYQGIGALLCASPNLRSFTYEHARLDICDKQFRRDLTRAKHLRILTMYSQLRIQDNVIPSLIKELTSNMPRLEAFHLHYTALTGTEVRLTWLARERSPKTRTRGTMVTNKPCTFCSRSTFIGLASPRNRSDFRF